MSDISNRTLAMLLVTSIVITLGFSVFTLTQLNDLPSTGMASSGSGRVNFTVESSVSIVLTNSLIDFGSGYVNSSKAVCNTNATLNAGATYNDTENNDCWVDTAATAPVSFNIQNDGNRNVQLQVIGPDQRAFLNYSGSQPNNLTWKARNNETGACIGTAGAGLSSAVYQDFAGSLKTICTNLSYQPSNADEIAVDIKLIIPVDITPGLRTNSTVDFQASATN